MTERSKRQRPDSQITGMAGEFLTAGKLFKRGYQVSVTLGNAKGVDLFVYNAKTDRTFTVQVKALRTKNCFPMRRENLEPDHVYVFVLLNGPEEAEEFFIVPGKTILKDINHFFGTSYQREVPSTFPAVNHGPLKEFKDNWQEFERY
jgi:hypothetical protein